MSWSDPIADMLTRIRNATKANLETVDIPHSKMKAEMLKALKSEGYIVDFVAEGTERKVERVRLKYGPDGTPAITGIQRRSKPGLRVYVGSAEIPRVLGGMGIVILSTSAGIMTGNEAKRRQIGGELLCAVW
jgi:small subunit ribosomal protein S8